MNTSKSIRLASFDIGKVNFAHYIEDINVEKILELEKEYNKLPKKLQRKTKGELIPQMKKIIDELYLTGNRIHTGVYDIRVSKEDVFDINTRKNLICHLDSYRSLFDKCDIFIIEQQYFKTWSGRRKRGGHSASPGTEANVDAIKIAESVVMWLLCEYPLKEVMYFGSQNKTQILGAPWNLTKAQRKKWSSIECRRLYELRGDASLIDLFNLEDRVFRKRLDNESKIKTYLETYNTNNSDDGKELANKVVRNRQKLDDISDACLQAQAFKFKTMVACF